MQFVSDYMKAIDFIALSGAPRYRCCFILSSGVHLAFGCSNCRSHLGVQVGCLVSSDGFAHSAPFNCD